MNSYDVQRIAKEAMAFIKSQVKAGMTLPHLRQLAENKMIELGATSFWYWDIGAFVFSGDETTLSVSGKNYKTTERVILDNDIVTVDLSPQVGDVWGDYARTLIIEDGVLTEDIGKIRNREWKEGLLTENKLHKAMSEYVTLQTTFEELYFYMNNLIDLCGYANLDFMGNLGHSIATDKADRIYIEQGNKVALGSVKYFTFEPHISLRGSKYGFKKEDVYYFENGLLKEL